MLCVQVCMGVSGGKDNIHKSKVAPLQIRLYDWPSNIKSCTVLMLWYIHHIVYIYTSIFIHKFVSHSASMW